METLLVVLVLLLPVAWLLAWLAWVLMVLVGLLPLLPLVGAGVLILSLLATPLVIGSFFGTFWGVMTALASLSLFPPLIHRFQVVEDFSDKWLPQNDSGDGR